MGSGCGGRGLNAELRRETAVHSRPRTEATVAGAEGEGERGRVVRERWQSLLGCAGCGQEEGLPARGWGQGEELGALQGMPSER